MLPTMAWEMIPCFSVHSVIASELHCCNMCPRPKYPSFGDASIQAFQKSLQLVCFTFSGMHQYPNPAAWSSLRV